MHQQSIGTNNFYWLRVFLFCLILEFQFLSHQPRRTIAGFSEFRICINQNFPLCQSVIKFMRCSGENKRANNLGISILRDIKTLSTTPAILIFSDSGTILTANQWTLNTFLGVVESSSWTCYRFFWYGMSKFIFFPKLRYMYFRFDDPILSFQLPLALNNIFLHAYEFRIQVSVSFIYLFQTFETHTFKIS